MWLLILAPHSCGGCRPLFCCGASPPPPLAASSLRVVPVFPRYRRTPPPSPFPLILPFSPIHIRILLLKPPHAFTPRCKYRHLAATSHQSVCQDKFHSQCIIFSLSPPSPPAYPQSTPRHPVFPPLPRPFLSIFLPACNRQLHCGSNHFSVWAIPGRNSGGMY